MGGENRAKTLRVALAASSLVLIVIGLGFALAGAWFGWVLAAFGVIDLAASQFVAALITARRGKARQAPGPSEAPSPAPEPDPTVDPSYNPYARED